MSFFSGLLSKVEETVEQAMPGKLDKYFESLRATISTKTHDAVYNELHRSAVAPGPLREVLEAAVAALPIHPPKALAGPALALLQKMEFGKEGGHGETGIAGFVRDVIRRNELDTEVRRAATRGVLRFAQEHREFVQRVGVEALTQKLMQQPVATEKNVPYAKPPVMSQEEFDRAFPEPKERGLFGDLIQGAVSSIANNSNNNNVGGGLIQAVVSHVQNDPTIQKKIDEYAQEIKVKVVTETKRTVYEQSHAHAVQVVLRKVIEHAVEQLNISSPVAKIGSFLANLGQSGSNRGLTDLTSTPQGQKSFFEQQVSRYGLDTSVKQAALRALEHFLIEHKEFLLKVGVESLNQKLVKDEGGKIDTTQAVPYVKPTPLSTEEFNQISPEPVVATTAPTASTAAPTAATATQPSSRSLH